jgi:lysozyme
MNDSLIFATVRRMKQRWTRKQAGLTQAEVGELNAALEAAKGEAPTPSPKPSDGLSGLKGPLVAIVGTIAATSLLASVPEEEGLEYKAYRDIAGIWTICAGDTNDVRAGLVETPEGCRQRLEKQLVAHAKPVMACTPRLSERGRDWQRAAAVSLAYNVGVGAWCRSTADRRFDAGDWRGGCDAFLSWNKARVGGTLRPVLGLTRRRQRERDLCLRGVA